MMTRSPARSTSSAISSSPSSGEGSCPDVRMPESTPNPISVSSASNGSRHVKGAVTGHAQRPRQLDQDAHPLNIHAAVWGEQPDHDPVDPELLAKRNVQLHRLELNVRVAEVAPTRADDDIHGDLQQPAGELDRAHAGGAAALQQVGAQLDPVGAARLHGKRSLDGIHTSLKQNVRGHRQLLTDTWPQRVQRIRVLLDLGEQFDLRPGAIQVVPHGRCVL